jgi:TolA-binding protein
VLDRPLPASTLAAQNGLFSAALSARRRGDLPGARRYLDELVWRFPEGPLADSARAERDELDSSSP